ncbi:cohesin domain-containing protein [Candidatus Poribacteria bacterium]
MKKHTFFIIAFVWTLVFAIATQATTVRVDPPTIDSPEVGETLVVSVKVEDVDGLFGYLLELAFDNTALKFSSIAAGEFLGNDGTETLNFLKVNGQQVYFGDIPEALALLLTNGQITPDIAAEVNAAGVLTAIGTRLGSVANIDGSGVLIAVTFEVMQVKESTLELQKVELGTFSSDSNAEFIPADTENGVIVVPEIKGDLSGNGAVGSDDALLALRIAVGQLIPTDYQMSVGDMDGDGRIRANDALMILQIVVGVAAPGIDTVADRGAPITVTLAEVHGVAGESITVPVKVDNTQGVAGGDISIRYDPEVLRAVNISPDPHVIMASNLREAGIARIAFMSIDGLASKTLAQIQFDVLVDDTSPLALRTVELYTPGAQPLPSRSIDKRFTSWAMRPEKSALLQNFPNPFNPQTWIPYQLRDSSDVTIRIYNSVGELVRELDLGYKSAGLYVSQDRAAYWDGKTKFGTDIASGVYFYSIQAGDLVAVRKLIALR